MTRQELAAAAETLNEASDRASEADVKSGLDEQAAQMTRLADADRGPDHGRLARHERMLSNLADQTDQETAELIFAALADIRDYRSTIEGV